MKRIRNLHAIGTIVTALGLVALLYGPSRIAVALIAAATLIQFASLEALRVAAAAARKVNS